MLLAFSTGRWTLALVLVAAMILLGLADALYASAADTLPVAIAPRGLTGRYSALHQLAWGVSGPIAPSVAAFGLAWSARGLWISLALASIAVAGCYAVLTRRVESRRPVAMDHPVAQP